MVGWGGETKTVHMHAPLVLGSLSTNLVGLDSSGGDIITDKWTGRRTLLIPPLGPMIEGIKIHVPCLASHAANLVRFGPEV